MSFSFLGALFHFKHNSDASKCPVHGFHPNYYKGSVVLATRTIEKGEIITDFDLREDEDYISSDSDAYTYKGPILGRRAKNVIIKGHMIAVRDLDPQIKMFFELEEKDKQLISALVPKGKTVVFRSKCKIPKGAGIYSSLVEINQIENSQSPERPVKLYRELHGRKVRHEIRPGQIIKDSDFLPW